MTSDAQEPEQPKRRIPIGSQRAGVPVPKLPPRHVLVTPSAAAAPPAGVAQPAERGPEEPTPIVQPTVVQTPIVDVAAEALARHKQKQLEQKERDQKQRESRKSPRAQPAPPATRVEVPNLRAPLEDDLASEFEEALGDIEIDALLDATVPAKAEAAIEPGTRLSGTVIRVGADTAFIDLGARRQGALKLVGIEPESFPAVGDPIDVTVGSRNDEDGLYDVAPANRAVSVDDYSQIEAGMIVAARVVAANKGGLEADVAGLRGFIPASLVSVWRVENLEELVGQTLECLVTEIVPAARRLVLSRRAVIERQAADAKAKLLETLEVGSLLDGIVRSVRDFGAFIDIGHGVEGLVHVSQLSWDRVANPSDVLQPGQAIRVVVKKIDRDTGKISLSARDLVESPWKRAADKYHVGATVRGTVSRIAQFGAFVRLEPGVEGLVHVSELAHRHVRSVSDVAKEGEEVECRVLSIDPDEQRMSLSIKAVASKPAVDAGEPTSADAGTFADAGRSGGDGEAPVQPAAAVRRKNVPLKGGIGGPSTGERFGLKW